MKREPHPESTAADLASTLSPPIRCQFRARLDERTERFALRALLTTARLLGLAAGTHLRHLRNLGDPLTTLQARLDEALLQARLAWEILEIQSARFRKVPDKERPHYSPAQRFRALEIRNLLGWSRDIAARVFLVCPNTISNWERSSDPFAKTVGSTVKSTPPVRRFADVVRATVALMARCGFGGEDTISLVLARAGWRVSPRSVRRMTASATRPGPESVPPARPSRPVIARYVNHVWMMDVTEIRAFLGGQVFHMAGVFDAFSRAPLALEVTECKPGAARMARLLRSAVRVFGVPRYLITDLGGEFRGGVFRKVVARLGVRQRFASALNIHATARLERYWKTIKDTASLRLRRPLTIDDLERRLEPALTHYLLFRPHQGLHGITPAEAFCGVEPPKAVSPPRGRLGDGLSEPPLTVGYLDPASRAFPILKKTA